MQKALKKVFNPTASDDKTVVRAKKLDKKVAGHLNTRRPDSAWPTQYNDLHKDEITQLTKVLSHYQSPVVAENSVQWQSYERTIAAEVEALPRHLKRAIPGAYMLVRFLTKLGYENVVPAAKVCHMHGKLNAQIIWSILHDVLDYEVKEGLDKTLPKLAATGCLSEEQIELVHEVQNTMALWTPAKTFQRWFDRKPSFKWRYQGDHCAACVLARIGSDPSVVVGLYALIKCKLPKDSGHRSKRLRWLRGWMYAFDGDATGEKLLQQAKSLAVTLYEMRKQGELVLSEQRKAQKSAAKARSNDLTTARPSVAGKMSSLAGEDQRDVSDAPGRRDTLESAHFFAHSKVNAYLRTPQVSKVSMRNTQYDHEDKQPLLNEFQVLDQRSDVTFINADEDVPGPAGRPHTARSVSPVDEQSEYIPPRADWMRNPFAPEASKSTSSQGHGSRTAYGSSSDSHPFSSVSSYSDIPRTWADIGHNHRERSPVRRFPDASSIYSQAHASDYVRPHGSGRAPPRSTPGLSSVRIQLEEPDWTARDRKGKRGDDEHPAGLDKHLRGMRIADDGPRSPISLDELMGFYERRSNDRS